MSQYHRAAIANSLSKKYPPLPPPIPPPSIPDDRLLTSRDPYYGLEAESKMYARYINNILKCKSDIEVKDDRKRSIPLGIFIATAIHRTPALNSKTPIAALLLLSRIRANHPLIASYANAHQLFIVVYKIASKALHEQTYQDWSLIAQNVYSENEIAECERTLLSLLKDSLELTWIMISFFECLQSRDYKEERKSYPEPYSASMLFHRSSCVANSSVYVPKLGLSSMDVIPPELEKKGLADSLVDLQRQLLAGSKKSR